jgi:predicted phosphoadenosine phosphosulfate sulfurtransferase
MKTYKLWNDETEIIIEGNSLYDALYRADLPTSVLHKFNWELIGENVLEFSHQML